MELIRHFGFSIINGEKRIRIQSMKEVQFIIPLLLRTIHPFNKNNNNPEGFSEMLPVSLKA